jgi:hypothetical protein
MPLFSWHFFSAKYALLSEGNDRDAGSAAGAVVHRETMNGGSQSPALSSQFSPLVIDRLLTHPKPCVPLRSGTAISLTTMAPLPFTLLAGRQLPEGEC